MPRLGADAREDIRNAAEPILHGDEYIWMRQQHEYMSNTTLPRGMVALLAAAVGDPMVVHVDSHRSSVRMPEVALTHRAYAAAETLRRRPSVRCVSLPSWSDGRIDAADLHARLAAAASEGWEPDPVDLGQALLRLDARSTSATDFADITSNAGVAVRTWATAGPPLLPELRLLTVQEQVFVSTIDPHDATVLKARFLTMPTFAPPPDHYERPSPTHQQDSLWTLLCSATFSSDRIGVGYEPGSTYGAWPTLAPFHPDVIATHLCLDLIDARSHSCDETGTLVKLAESPGPSGEALLTAIGYGLGAKLAVRRAAAVDALLTLTARQRFDGAAFGRVLARLLDDGSIVSTRVVPSLSDLARSGAADPLWQALRTLLANFLDRTPRPSGLVDFLVLAAETADLAHARGTVHGLDALADSKGKTRQVVEARRLRTILASPVR